MNLQELKDRATELGIKFDPRCKEKKLLKLIKQAEKKISLPISKAGNIPEKESMKEEVKEEVVEEKVVEETQEECLPIVEEQFDIFEDKKILKEGIIRNVFSEGDSEDVGHKEEDTKKPLKIKSLIPNRFECKDFHIEGFSTIEVEEKFMLNTFISKRINRQIETGFFEVVE